MKIIIDLTKNSPAAKPIELVSCLQRSRNRNGEHYFYEGRNYEGHLKSADKITRLSTLNLDNLEYDLIETDTRGDKNIFLGHWNDGFVE